MNDRGEEELEEERVSSGVVEGERGKREKGGGRGEGKKERRR